MPNRLFWIVYVPAVLLGTAFYQHFDPPQPPATNVAEFVGQVLGGALVFAALGGVLAFGLNWYRVRPGSVKTIPHDRLRRDVVWITLGVLVLMILYSLGRTAGLGTGTP